MKQLSFLVIEDNEVDAHRLMQLLSELPMLYQVDWLQTADNVFNYLNEKKYDTIFMDIRMPDLLGTDLLYNTPKRPPVIVVTAYIEYAVACYDLNVVDFLVKPFDRSRLQRAINRALTNYAPLVSSQSGSSIFLPANRRMQQFHFKDIRFIEAYGAYAKIYEKHGSTTVSSSISWLETQLPASQFIRVQKSFIINSTFITALEARSVWIDNTKITIGEPYRDLVKQLISAGRENNKGTAIPNN